MFIQVERDMATFELDYNPNPEQADKIASFTLNYLQEVTPVRTGLLRSSWSVAVVGNRIEVDNDCPYYHFVDGGTSRMAARNMTADTEPEAVDFANLIRGADDFLAKARLLQRELTGDDDVDAAIWEAATAALGSRKSVDESPVALGLLDIGSRTLLAYKPAVNLAADPILSALDDSAKQLGISPQRYKTLRAEYGQSGSRFDYSPIVSN